MVPAESAASPCAPVSCARAGSNSGSGMNALHRAVLRATDIDAARPTGMALVVRLIVRDVQRVVGRDVNAARPAELRPLLEEVVRPDRRSGRGCCRDPRRIAALASRARGRAARGIVPGSLPVPPHSLMNVPSAANFTMRLFDIGSWPSLTNTLPLRRDDDVGRAVEVRRPVAGVRRGCRAAAARGRRART